MKNISIYTESENITIIENASDEILEIASEVGLVYPSNSFKIFKCIFAKLNEPNKNGIILTKEEVASKLDTLKGKPVNINHNKKEIKNAGYWLKGEIAGENIVAWGLFWNHVYKDEYATFKQDAEEGKGRVSFEMTRFYSKDEVKPVTAKIVEFIGGAILNTSVAPACPDAKILSFASVEEQARVYSYNVDSMINSVSDTKCPKCDSSWKDIQKIDFIDNEITCQCKECLVSYNIELNPVTRMNEIEGLDFDLDDEYYNVENHYNQLINSIKSEEAKVLTAKDKSNLPDEDFGLIQNVKSKLNGKNIKIRRFPINDEAHVRNALARFDFAKNITEEEKKSLKDKILKKAKMLKMTELLSNYKTQTEKAQMDEKELLVQIENLKSELANLKDELAKKELEVQNKSEELASKDTKISELATKIDEIPEKIEKARQDAVTVTNRRTELAEFAKEISDSDLLNDDKYALLQLKKENAELKLNLSKVPPPVKNETAEMVTGTVTEVASDKSNYLQSLIEKRNSIYKNINKQ